MFQNLVAVLFLFQFSVILAEETFQLKLSCSPNPNNPEIPCPPNAYICFRRFQFIVDNISNCMGSTWGDLTNTSTTEFNFDLPSKYHGLFNLIIETWNENNAVDRIIEHNQVRINNTWKSVIYNGTNTLDYSYRIICKENYYGNNCSIYCEGRDDDSGHYSCDETEGNIVCLEGWEGTRCEKAKCTSTCANSTGYCNTPNTCICKPGWNGADCTEKDDPVRFPLPLPPELPRQRSTQHAEYVWTGCTTIRSRADHPCTQGYRICGQESCEDDRTEQKYKCCKNSPNPRGRIGSRIEEFELPESNNGIDPDSNSLDPNTEIFEGENRVRRKSDFPIQNSERGKGRPIIPEGHTNSTLIISICVTVLLGSIVIGGVVAATTKYYLTRKPSPVLSDAEMQQFLKGDENSMCISNRNYLEAVPYNEDYEIGQENLSIDVMTILGSGAFGIVFHGVCDGHPVAVKTVRAGTEKEYFLALLSELKVLIYLKGHPNLVSLVGAQTKDIRHGKLFVVVELCSEGSLEKYLSKLRDTLMKSCQKLNYVDPGSDRFDPTYNSIAQLLRWGYQICLAMEYLESMKVIHSDLATRNVLLTETLQAKVSDFGLSRKLYQYDVYVKKHKAPLPWRWMAIESLQRKEFSHKSDCWSFGVTLWEIFSLGDTPYHGMEYTLDFVARLSEGMRLNRPPFAPENIFVLMEQCWENDPESRPTFSILKNKLSETLNNSSFLYEENHPIMELDRSASNYDGLLYESRHRPEFQFQLEEIIV